MRIVFGISVIAMTTVLGGCLSSGSSSKNANDETVEPAVFSLQLLHFADVDGGGTAAMFNVDQFSALVLHFRDEMPDNTLLVSSGDNYIPGPIFQASQDPRMAAVVGVPGEGRGETQIQNKLGLQASAVGNHDLDTGPAGFAGIISADESYPGAEFPYISSNIDFSTDTNTASLVVTSGQEASTVPGKLSSSVVVTVDGEKIGLVGAVTPTLPSITSVGNLGILPAAYTMDDAGLDALAEVIQEEVDALTDMDINKIILLSHMQVLNVERGLATRLNDVDIIVGGGSNSILANGLDILREGDTAADHYPVSYTSPTNQPVLLVTTDADYKYLGRLVVNFDAEGVIIEDSIDPADSGAWAATNSMVSMLGAEAIPEVVEVAEVIREILGELDGNAFGITEVFLDGRRDFVRSRETNLGNLSADANLWYGQQMDLARPPLISVKNGGGIRAPIGQITSPAGSTSADDIVLLPPAGNDFGKPEGGISQLDIQTAFAFNNGLALVTMTAAELRDLMEEMLKSGFTHTAGVRVEFDRSRPTRSAGDTNLGAATDGQWVRRMEVLVDPDATNPADRWDLIVDNGALVGDASRSFRVIALDFLAGCAALPDSAFFSPNCGSGWPFKNLQNAQFTSLLQDELAARDPGRADFSSTGGEQDAFAEYLQVFHANAANAYKVPVNVNERLIPTP